MKAYRKTRDKTSTILLLLTGILLIGTVLRIYDLGTESLWIDEAISMLWAKQSPSHIMARAALDVHPPLYFVILHYWINLFGDSEFSARLLSAIIGIISIFMIFKVGSLIFGSDVGLLSAFIMATSVFHIWYSQDARAYSLLVLMSLLSIFFFIQLYRRKSRRDSIGYIVFSCLLIYTHYFGFFIIIAQNIFYCTLFFLTKEKNDMGIKRWVLLQGLLIISYLPWGGKLIKQLLTIGRGETDTLSWITMPSFYTPIDSLKTYAGSLELMSLFLTFAVFAIISYKKNYSKGEVYFSNVTSMYLLALWLAIPVILPVILSYIFKPIYETRYTISASLALYILAAKGIQNTNNRFVKYSVIIIIAALSLTNAKHYYDRIDKQQWREAITYVGESAKTGDKIIFLPGGPFNAQIWDYYSQRKDLIKEPFVLKGNDKDNINNVKTAVAGYDRIWFIVSGGKDFKDIFQEVLQQSSYHLLLDRRYDGMSALPEWAIIQVILYERQDTGA